MVWLDKLAMAAIYWVLSGLPLNIIWRQGMKNRWTVILGFLILVCLITSCGTTGGATDGNSSSASKLFIVKEDTINDIQGTIYEKSMDIYSAPSGSLYLLFVTFLNRSKEDISANMVDLFYYGKEWRFYEEIQVKIDEKLFTLKGNEPSRNVRKSGFVEEFFRVLLPDDAVEALGSCKSILVQLNGKTRGEPITIDPKGIPAINSFFK
jgi:hypothetical protein